MITALIFGDDMKTAITFLVSCLVVPLASVGVRAQVPRPDPYKTSPELERRGQRVTPEDLRVLKRADEMLATPASWNRHDARVCPARATRWSLFCALQDAAHEVFGEERYRALAIQEVRFTVEDRMTGLAIQHRLTDYNNLPSTRFADIKDVLKVTMDRVAARLAAQQQ